MISRSVFEQKPVRNVGSIDAAKIMNSNGRTFYRVTLEPEERVSLREIVGGTGSRERRKRAHILLRTDIERDGGGLRDAEIAHGLPVGPATVERVRKPCVMEGVEAALVRTGPRKAPKNRKRRLRNGKGEAPLTRRACSDPPDGRTKEARPGPSPGWVRNALNSTSWRRCPPKRSGGR